MQKGGLGQDRGYYIGIMFFKGKKEEVRRTRSAEDLFYDSGESLQEEMEKTRDLPKQEEEETAYKIKSQVRSPDLQLTSSIEPLEDSPLAYIDKQRWLYRVSYRDKTIVEGTCRYHFHAKQRVRFYSWMKRRQLEKEYKRDYNDAHRMNILLDYGLQQIGASRIASARGLQIKELGPDLVLISWRGDDEARGLFSSRRHYRSWGESNRKGCWALVWSRQGKAAVIHADKRFTLRSRARKDALAQLKQQLLQEKNSKPASSAGQRYQIY